MCLAPREGLRIALARELIDAGRGFSHVGEVLGGKFLRERNGCQEEVPRESAVLGLNYPACLRHLNGVGMVCSHVRIR